MSPSMPSIMELMILNIIERKRGVAWKIRKQIAQPPSLVSYVLMSLNA